MKAIKNKIARILQPSLLKEIDSLVKENAQLREELKQTDVRLKEASRLAVDSILEKEGIKPTSSSKLSKSTSRQRD